MMKWSDSNSKSSSLKVKVLKKIKTWNHESKASGPESGLGTKVEELPWWFSD